MTQDGSNEVIRLPESAVLALAADFLLSHGLGADHAGSMARILTAAQRDGCLSHGLQRLPGTRDTISHPRFNRTPDPKPVDVSAAITRIDAQYGFSCLAVDRGLSSLVEKARTLGVAILAVNNGFHSTALWPVVEAIADHGLVALSMNPTHAWVAPSGGRQGLLGTNPLAFAWPRRDAPPYVFDFATSAAARAEIARYRQEGRTTPEGWGLDSDGEDTRDPAAILAGAMLPFGGHKGSALATMIELMAGPFIADRTSRVSMEFDAGASAAPCHGELIIAFSPGILGDEDPLDAAESLFQGFREQDARLPGERRYRERETSHRLGIPVSKSLLERIRV
ncbi:Ldh family oxidoreductase [Shinella daejeonensis]|uniref:Ldh family oxidoreductase n=1 Tax=Shinella daejeonensis TaxID=659017 RepID=UPI0020C7CBB5|nr:Ldh family oxidoreductase [Shinella daejeonensis]MCP8896589.1 Ldh family oxidoreductase [Shinella daejeonensis]